MRGHVVLVTHYKPIAPWPIQVVQIPPTNLVGCRVSNRSIVVTGHVQCDATLLRHVRTPTITNPRLRRHECLCVAHDRYDLRRGLSMANELDQHVDIRLLASARVKFVVDVAIGTPSIRWFAYYFWSHEWLFGHQNKLYVAHP